MKIEKLIITGLNKVNNTQKAIIKSAAIAKNYEKVRDIIDNRITVNWEANSEAVAWSDHRKKLIYGFDNEVIQNE